MNEDKKIEGQPKADEQDTKAETDKNDTVTMSKVDYDKAIQSAEDKIRGEYARKVKKLEEQVAKLTPPEKTEAEIALEEREAKLKAKEEENAAKETLLNLQSYLQTNDVDKEFADFLKADADAEAFVAVVNGYVNKKLSASGYRPTGHQNNPPLSKSDYQQMSYDQMVELYNRDPEARKRFKTK